MKYGITAVFGGYLAATLGDQLLFPDGERGWGIATQTLTLVACGLAMLLVWRGRVRAGALLTIGSVWVELHSGIPAVGIDLSALIPLPVLVSGAGILLGVRAAFILAGLSSATIVLLSWGSAALGLGPGLGTPRAPYLWLVVTVTMFVAAALVHLGLDAFGRVLAAARASERRVADLLESAPDGVLAAEVTGLVVSANPAAAALLGRSKDDLLGRPLREVLEAACYDGDDVRALRALLRSEEQRSAELRLQPKTGEARWAETVVGPVHWADGSVGRQVTLRDTTERQRAVASERSLRMQLEHAQRLEALGRLAGGVAHEFNNLLTVVGGAAELLLQRTSGEAAELASDILKAQGRGAALTRQMLAFARKETTRPRSLELRSTILDLEPLLKRFLDEDRRLTLRLDPEVPLVRADRAQVEQVLVNLVTNARDAMEAPGHVVVGLAGPGAPQHWGPSMHWVVAEGSVELWVEDTGRGMEPDVAARACEPFFTTKPPGEGTGLGLAVVHGIVAQSGGTLEILSKPGRGTRVVVRLPVAKTE